MCASTSTTHACNGRNISRPFADRSTFCCPSTLLRTANEVSVYIWIVPASGESAAAYSRLLINGLIHYRWSNSLVFSSVNAFGSLDPFLQHMHRRHFRAETYGLVAGVLSIVSSTLLSAAYRQCIHTHTRTHAYNIYFHNSAVGLLIVCSILFTLAIPVDLVRRAS